MNDPVKRIRRPGCTILVFEGADGLDRFDDNVDVEVHLPDGSRWGATFFTLKNVQTLMNKNRRTGECGGGLYIWAADMVLVEELTHGTIIATVEELIAQGDLQKIFQHFVDSEEE
jgi:hypothetical protein